MAVPVVWLHGVGGPPRGPFWRRQLDRDLRRHGHPGLAPQDGIAIDYQQVLIGGRGGSRLLAPLPAAEPEAYEAARAAYTERRTRLAELVEPWRDADPGPRLTSLPDAARWLLVWGARELPWQGFPLARLYLTRPALRRRVMATALTQLPQQPFVLVAHSLGSVLTVDLLRFLPPGRIQMLVTVGSPLGLPDQGRPRALLDPFPYDRVGAWVNLRTRWDWVTGGVALDDVVPQIVDLPLATSAEARQHHWRSTYLSHPATLAAIAAGRAGAWTTGPAR